MRRPSPNPKLQMQILQHLAKVQYATSKQLAQLCDSHASHISNALKILRDLDWVEVQEHVRPMIIGLSLASSRILGVSMPSGKRYSSWSVMAHACHLTEAQTWMAARHQGFRLLSRKSLLSQGFNPAFGEHGGVDDSGASWFVLLDDYGMGSERIKHSWERRHTPDMKYYPDFTGRKMCQSVRNYIIFTTTEEQLKKHVRELMRKELPAKVALINPLWPR